MKLKIISFPKRHSRNYVVKRVEGLCDILTEYDIEMLQVERYKTLNQHGQPEEFFAKNSIIFEHEDGTFKMIDWDDRDNPSKYTAREIVKSPNCQFILKCQYNKFKTINPKVRPFFYFEKHDPHILSANLDEYRKTMKLKEMGLYWRGNLHLGRQEVLEQLPILNQGWKDLVPLNNYLQELASSRVALSLPGLGRACHREFEAFAVGTPVIMPKFHNHYYDDLIPDDHYISLDVSDGFFQKKPKEMAQMILDRYQSVIRDEELLEYIRINAMRYYDKYIRYENSLKWFKLLLEL